MATTLVVVPKPLLQHWAEQLRKLVDLAAISPLGAAAGGRGAVWVDDCGTTRDLADVDAELPVPCHGGASASPLLDEPGLPAVWARYAIVVTSFERCASEARRADEWSSALWAADESRRSPLTALRWLRLVVDEGHALGGGAEAQSISSQDASRFISGLAAERRWVLSGTPTVGTDERASLLQLHQLLAFLREPELGLQPRRQWVSRLERPFLRREPAAEAHVLRVLLPIMVRHTKEDVRLPDPKVYGEAWDGRRTWHRGLQTERQHVDDVFKGAAERVLSRLLAARAGGARGAREGAERSAGDLREIGGAMEWREARSGSSALARRPVKAIVYADGSRDLEQFQHFLVQGWAREHRTSEAVANEAVALHYVSDGRDYRASELSRFRHNSLRCRECPSCGLLNDEHDAGDRCTRFLITARIDATPAVGPQPVDPLSGHSISVEEERVEIADASAPTGWRPWSVEDFYAAHGVSKRVRVRCLGPVEGSTLPAPAVPPAADVAALLPHGGRLRYGTFVGHTRCKCSLGAAKWETRRVDTPVMLLCADGSHGLDLSFGTHIFLLGRVSDPAIKQQVVSRADRMGAVPDATGRGCEVETLLLWHDEELRSPTKVKKKRYRREVSGER